MSSLLWRWPFEVAMPVRHQSVSHPGCHLCHNFESWQKCYRPVKLIQTEIHTSIPYTCTNIATCISSFHKWTQWKVKKNHHYLMIQQYSSNWQWRNRYILMDGMISSTQSATLPQHIYISPYQLYYSQIWVYIKLNLS